MPQNLEKNEEIWHRLRAGEDKATIVADGFNRETVNRTKKVEKGEQSPWRKGWRPCPLLSTRRGGVGRDASDTVVRLTQQQIVLPGGMFILYDHCRRLDPDLEISPSEWLQLVVQCWAEDHAEELQLNPMMWAQNPEQYEESDATESRQATTEPLPGAEHEEGGQLEGAPDGEGRLVAANGGPNRDER